MSSHIESIKCEHPVIIRNHHFKHMMLTFGCWHEPDGIHRINQSTKVAYEKSFPWRKFNPYNTSGDLNEYYFINILTGECFPMYYRVPCGKCALCREARVTEWAFRAHCESSVSETIPLYLTFTYEKEPEKGVEVSHMQDFLKRLRTGLVDKGFDIANKLRYLCVAEYGQKKEYTRRAHYHMIIWNFPYFDDHSLYNDVLTRDFIIEKWTHGFVKTLPLLSGGTSYVLKYMRKDCVVPEGKNDTFMLYSRGLGREVCDNFTDFYRKNPTKLDISVYDKYTGQTFTYKLPQYFKTRIFPTLSRLVPKEIRDAFVIMNEVYRNYPVLHPYWDKKVESLRARFSFLPVFEFDWDKWKPKGGINEKWILTQVDSDNRIINNFRTAVVALENYYPDYEFIVECLTRLGTRQAFIESLPKEYYDISAMLSKLRKKVLKQREKLVF